MLARQRQELILARLSVDGAVRVTDLTEALGVSDMTIRRDLETLAEQGLAEKVHGGATLPGTRTAKEPGFDTKAALGQPEKTAIAQAAISLVRPGMAIGLSGGSTTAVFARALAQLQGVTVVTNSLPVAETLHRSASQAGDSTSVVLTGGQRTPSDALVGPVAVRSLRSLNLDLAFLGVHGMDRRAGLTTPNLAEAETNQALVASARQLVVLADHTKWGLVGLSSIAPLTAVDVLITDSGLDPQARTELAELVGQLTVVDPVR